MIQSWEDQQLKQKIGQMIVVRTSGYLFDHQIRYPDWEATNNTLKRWLGELNLGGVILLGGSAAELKIKIETLQTWANNLLLICADIEEGVGQRFAGATAFPPPMALGEIAKTNLGLAQKLAFQMGEITAKEALTVGINWLLTPVVDVNNNPDNPVINIRAFGEDPKIVTQLITAFIEGTKTYPVLSTAKHFPGHGDTAIDSHLDLPEIPHSVERLESLELLPFRSAIQANVDSIMTGHLLVTAWDKKEPATLSTEILTHQLRQKLNFQGLIVTDALIMKGVTKQYSDEAIAIKAVQAGNDILLMPSSPEVAINAIYNAVKSGLISQQRIETSWQRIQLAKKKITSASSKLDFFSLSNDHSTQVVDQIITHSLITRGQFPLESLPSQGGRNLMIVDDLLNLPFLERQSPAIAIPHQQGYHLKLIDAQSLSYIRESSIATLLQVFVRGNPFRGNTGFNENNKLLYQSLLQKGEIKGIIIYGSPYIKDWFLTQIDKNIPLVFSYGQIPQSQAFALQMMFNLPNKTREKDFNFGF